MSHSKPTSKYHWREVLKTQFLGLKPLLQIALFLLLGVFILSLILGSYLDGWTDSKKLLSQPPPLRGMALGLFSQESDYPYERDLQEIKNLGANAILLMVPWYQKNIRSNHIEARFGISSENDTTPDELLTRVIEEAHRLGMKVLLMPFIRFDHRSQKEWRGVLAPENFSVWSQNYENFILQYADLAQKIGVEYFSVGSELGSLENKQDFWDPLIKKVRGRFSGKLIYSANWDHYVHPTFIRQLDAIGITSYYRLSNQDQPNLKQLKKSWSKFKKQILKYLKNYPKKKFIFTEVGYPSLVGGAKDPWNYVRTAPVDLKTQALAYQAFADIWNDTSQLEGVFWWVWYGAGGPKDTSYTPRGKPAAEVLRSWYLGPALSQKELAPPASTQ